MNKKISFFILIGASLLPFSLLATNMDQWCSNNTSDGTLCMAKLATTAKDSLVIQKCLSPGLHKSGQVEIKYSITKPALTTTVNSHPDRRVGDVYSFSSSISPEKLSPLSAAAPIQVCLYTHLDTGPKQTPPRHGFPPH